MVNKMTANATNRVRCRYLKNRFINTCTNYAYRLCFHGYNVCCCFLSLEIIINGIWPLVYFALSKNIRRRITFIVTFNNTLGSLACNSKKQALCTLCSSINLKTKCHYYKKQCRSSGRQCSCDLHEVNLSLFFFFCGR